MSYWQTMVASVFDRARQHAPQDRQTLHVAAQELRARGLTPRDIAAALRLSEAGVRDMLGEPQTPSVRPQDGPGNGHGADSAPTPSLPSGLAVASAGGADMRASVAS